MTEAEILALAREIAFRMAPDALLDAKDVGAMLKVSARYVTEHLTAAPGFPKAIHLNLADGRKGQPRWLRSDLVKYIDSHREGVTKRGGRPRKSIDW